MDPEIQSLHRTIDRLILRLDKMRDLAIEAHENWVSAEKSEFEGTSMWTDMQKEHHNLRDRIDNT